MLIYIMVEVPDERTVEDARQIAVAFNEEFDDVHVKGAFIYNEDGYFLLDLMGDET